jgi:hypothetical protein
MQETEFGNTRLASFDFHARAKLPCISNDALNALERRLQEHRLPAAEEAFLTARLATYRKLAQFALGGDCYCSASAA